MNYTAGTTLSLSFVALSAFAYNDPSPGAPQTDTLEPKTAKAGSILKIKGRSLEKARVDEVYLTDHRFDMKVKVLEQTNTEMTIRVPPFVKPGRLQLLYLTGGKNPVFLEQPFYVHIEDGEDTLPTAAPVQITKQTKTVEVASAGAKVPVPPAPAPMPMTSAKAPVAVAPVKDLSKDLNKDLNQAKTAKTEQPVQTPEVRKPEPPVIVAKSEVPTQPISQPAWDQQKPAPGATAPTTTPRTTAAVPPQMSQPQVQTQQAASVPVAPIPVNPAPAAAEPAIVPAQVLRRSRVTYPSSALSTKIEGLVELVAVVRADGRVKDVKVIKGNPYLVSAAVTSVRDWIYEPARVNGKAVESEVSVILNFKRP